MADLKFADTHNLVAFLSKPVESEGFEQIVDFLNANPIRYALTINPTIYISCIEQFWSIVKAKTVNGEVQLQALVDGKKIIITESTMRRDLQLEDAEGVDCLPNSTIFEQLTLMGYYLVNDQDDADMFDVNTLTGDEVLAEQEVTTKDVNLTVDEVTLAQALAALKSVKPKVKANIVEEPSVPVSAASTKVSAATTTTTATIPTPRKGIVITTLESEKPLKKKDQLKLDEEIALKLQAEFDEEERLTREKDEANRNLEQRRKDCTAKRAEDNRNKPDDIIIMRNHIPSLQSVKDYLGKCFAMKDLGETTFILGIKIYRDMSKRSIGLERLDLNKTQGASTPKEVKHMQNVPYASANPSELYWTAMKNILKYLRNTKDMFLVYGGNQEAELRVDCYCVAGFKTDRDDTKSQTRYVFILNGGAVDWKSSKQSTTTMSTTESEYIAASEAAIEAIWIRKFILGLGIVPTINEPIRMFCDNSAVLHFANEPVSVNAPNTTKRV
ncbi:hypothetical protein Tco_0140413 [Tanacetum coccineum]